MQFKEQCGVSYIFMLHPSPPDFLLSFQVRALLQPPKALDRQVGTAWAEGGLV
jgi:hypothetical protein